MVTPEGSREGRAAVSDSGYCIKRKLGRQRAPKALKCGNAEYDARDAETVSSCRS
jgi:hypothetical protein